MRVLVSGLGNLGLPLAEALLESGHEVRGTDPVPAAMDRARHAGVEVLRAPNGGPLFINDVDVNFVIVPTPSLNDGTFDPSLVAEAVSYAAPCAGIHAIVSTLLPSELLWVAHRQPLVGFELPRVVYCPEFVRLGHVREDMARPDFILVGADDHEAGDLVTDILRSLVADRDHTPLMRLSLVEAAVAKIAVNTFVTTKISFANMVAELCAPLGADAERVCRAVGHDHRIGNAYFRPGGSYAGPCFPRDNRAFAALAESVGASADLAEATDRINNRQRYPFPEEVGRGY